MFEGKTFEEAWENIKQRMPNISNFEPAQGGSLNGMPYTRYNGSDGEIRVIKVAEGKYLYVRGLLANSVGRMPMEPFYKQRLLKLWENTLNSIKKVS